ncbi:MAG: cell division ATP-binding protein FtsE [Erysipelotrichaceae bacterium]|nr:cell division ATP-binding protein FtsE [Erysipelotrichaceae bacterium]MDD4642414.1 cell division ATP-binding protein FtsE [Erysipelotrichaceae bacterium]
MLEFNDVGKQYKNGFNALYNVNLKIKQGEFVYVIGPTGSGKSTLMKLINAEETPTSGRVILDDVDIGALKSRQIPKHRQSLGVVFQDYRLLPAKTVFENIYFALEVINIEKTKARKRVREVLELVGLADKANSYPSQLSGGQQQRAAIARAIANQPKLLIADEPTGNLDPQMSKEIIHLLGKINKEEETTIIMVTHDEKVVDFYKKRTIILEDGHIVADLVEGGYRSHDH